MNVMSGIFLVSIVCGVIAIAAGIYVYSKHPDKEAVGGEIQDSYSHVSGPQATANIAYKIALMAVAVITLLSVSTVVGLLNSMQHAINSLQSSQDQLRSDIYELQEQLEKGETYVESCSWEIINPDYAGRTAKVDYSVRLRRYSEGTQVTLSLNGEDVALEQKSAGIYGTSLTAGFFEGYEQPMICITEDGRTVTEDGDFPEYVFWDLLPIPSLSCNLSSGMAFGKINYKGLFLIQAEHLDEIQSATVTYMTGGRDLKTVDVTEETVKQQWITLEKGLKLDKDLTSRIEIVTKNGFKIIDQSVMIFGADTDLDHMDFMRVYDMDDHMLWEENKFN